MKKRLITLTVLLVFILSAITGCGSDPAAAKITAETTGVRDVIESAMAEQSVRETSGIDTEDTTETSVTESGIRGSSGIDVDLTEMSANMVYATVYDMMFSPGRYTGKRIKMKGIYTVYHDEATDKYYFACFITDAAACCSQGIEFVLTDEYVFPDDYPEEGSEIVVEGIFSTYNEGDVKYCSLMDSRLG